MEEKKDFLDELAQNLMLIMIIAATICTLLSVVFQFISDDLKVLFTQLSFYTYGWMVFLALGPAAKRAMFMRIDLLINVMFPKAVLDALKLLCEIVMFVLMAALCWFSVQNLMNAVSAGEVNSAAPVIPLAAAYVAPVIGYALGIIAYIVKVMKGGNKA